MNYRGKNYRPAKERDISCKDCCFSREWQHAAYSPIHLQCDTLWPRRVGKHMTCDAARPKGENE